MNEIVDITPSISIWNIILLVEIGIGFILLILLCRICKKLNWYLPLVFYVLLVMLDCFSEFMLQTGYILNTPHLLYINEPLNLLIGLMIYLYARGQEFQSLRAGKYDLYLFTPFVLSLLTYIPFYMLSAEEKIMEFQQFGDVESDMENYVWEWIFLVGVNFSFLAAALLRFRNYNEKIKTLYSDIHDRGFHITQVLVVLCMSVYALELISVYLAYYELPFNVELYNIYDIVQLIILVLIGYDALTSYKHSAFIKEEWRKIHLESGSNIVDAIKYAKSNLTQEQSDEIKSKLEAYMKKHEPYLNSQLRIKDLADETHISSHQISQVLNESFQQNFYEFVNMYRVNKAKKLLADPKNESLTYSAIGFDAGFNSKTTFYSAFKKVTGTTPAQYKEKISH